MPQTYTDDHKFEQWVNNKRKAFKNGTLKPSWVACLNTLGFQAVVLTAILWSLSLLVSI